MFSCLTVVTRNYLEGSRAGTWIAGVAMGVLWPLPTGDWMPLRPRAIPAGGWAAKYESFHSLWEDNLMRHSTLVRPLLAACLVTAALTSCGKKATAPQPVDHSLTAVLQRTLANNHLPAVAGAMVHADSIAETVVLGVRKLGGTDSVRIADHFHLGSNVKAMTADLIALEVEAGHLAWDHTLAEIFPEFADSMRVEYRSVTLEALLQHRAGFPALTTLAEWQAIPAFPGTLAERRQAYAHWLLKQTPAVAPGQYLYSNGGYGLAGAILERTAAAAWESLVQSRLWSPLGIAGGHGWPAAGGAPQPWGHQDAGNGALVPSDPDGSYQFLDVLRACGDAYTSVGEYAEFVRLHLRGLRGQGALLSEATFQRLHTPNGGYALGWGVTTIAGSRTSFHLGSAGTFAVAAFIQPDRDLAVVVASNAGSTRAITAVQEAALELLKR